MCICMDDSTGITVTTSVSQILEQIFNAIVSLLAAWLFIKNLSDGTPEQVANCEESYTGYYMKKMLKEK